MEKRRKEAATWEDAVIIQEQFPEFHLEDKVDFGGGVMLENQFNRRRI